MQIPDEVATDLRHRLHRVGGQVAAIERMIDDGRECRELILQVSAATKALEQVGFRVLAAGLTYCVTDPQRAQADGYSLDEVQRLFMRLA